MNVSVLLLSLASPDESSLVTEHFHLRFIYGAYPAQNVHAFPTRALRSQKYEVEFLLQQQWYDPRLRYSNRSQYEYLNAIHHYDDIWLPDTYFIMHGDFKDPLIPVHFALRIYRNGTVNYLMRYRAAILGLARQFTSQTRDTRGSFERLRPRGYVQVLGSVSTLTCTLEIVQCCISCCYRFSHSSVIEN